MKQYTYMMLKPDAFENDKKDKILQMIEDHGLKIESAKEIKVDMDVMKTLLMIKGKHLIFLRAYLIHFILMDHITLCQ